MNSQRFKTTLLTAAITLVMTPAGVTAKPDHNRQFGRHAPFDISDLPTSRAKTRLKALQRTKRAKALKQLHEIDFSQHDLEHLDIDNEGDVLYSDSFDMTELIEIAENPAELPMAIAGADTFKLHSKPGASNVIYLDFNGHSFTGTAWGSNTYNARPFDTDGNSSSFNSSELAAIAEIWHRVAEDYAPFDVDVTTEEPTAFGPTTGRLLITHSKQVNGSDMPYSTAGGVAYVNVWGRSNYASYYSPALVYYNNLASYAPYVAEAAAHEMGHNLGLSHDATSSQGYYGGHGTGFVSWGPIMGVGYYTNVTQWSKGEYADASQFQDDISLITAKLNSRNDDHGNDMYSPSELLIDAHGNITATSPETDPHNQFPENKGFIETRDDVDFFAFDAGAGPLQITVTPAWDSFYRSSRRGANLDVQATLYNWDGQLIASSDPLDETDADINLTVASGQYLLAVTGVGNSITPYSDYGSLGQYFISGSVVPFSQNNDTTPPNPNPMGWAVAPFAQSRASISMQATPASDDSGSVQYNFTCVSGNGCSDSGWQSSNQFTATGLQAGTEYSFQVSARDAFGNMTEPSASASARTAANNTPQSENGSTITAEDSSVLINLGTLASDSDGDTLTFTVPATTSHGTLTHHGNGTVTYMPTANFNGSDSFSYTVSDGFAGSTSSSTISISVTPVNDAPVASASAPAENDSLTVTFSSANSFDPDANDSLSYHWNFGDGNTSNAANPTHNYANAGSYNAILTVTDSAGLRDSASVTTQVVDQNSALPATPTNLSAQKNRTFSGRRRSRTVTGTVAVNWDTADHADSYEVWSCQEMVSGRGNRKTVTCNYGLSGKTSATTYTQALSYFAVRFKVRAVNSNGVSSFSNEVRVSP